MYDPWPARVASVSLFINGVAWLLVAFGVIH